MHWSMVIAEIKGTKVRVHVTFVLFLLAIGAVIGFREGWEAAALGMTTLALLFVCVVLHEFGHVFAARHFGVFTGEIVLLPIGGVSRLERIPERPQEEIVIALAGPAVTLAIAVLLIFVLGGLPDPVEAFGETNGRAVLGQLAYLNLALLAFNLLPAFPLDGGRVLRAALASRLGYARGTSIAAHIGQGVAILLGVFALAAGHIILAMIAVVIFVAAGAEAGMARMRAVTAGLPAGESMITAFLTLPSRAPISDATTALIRSSQAEFPIIDADGRLEGVLTRNGIIKALAATGPSTPVAEAMHKDIPHVSHWHPMDEVVRLLGTGVPAVAVADKNGRLVGYVTVENLSEQVLIAKASRP